MTDLLSNLALGFGVTFAFVWYKFNIIGLGVVELPIPMNLIFCAIGALVACAAPGRGCRAHAA